MNDRTFGRTLLVLATCAMTITPTFARGGGHGGGGGHVGGFHGAVVHGGGWHGGGYHGGYHGYHRGWGGGYGGNPYYYNNYAYQQYAPYGAYGYNPNAAAVGVGIGAAVGGLLAGLHGHRYD